jgi:hypothetical protein
VEDLGVIVKCECADWAIYSDSIFTAQIRAAQALLIRPYSGPLWKFCPWCGKKLKSTKNDLSKIDLTPAY